MSVEPRKASFGLTFLGAVVLFCVAGLIAWLWLGRAGSQVETYDQKRATARVAKREELAKEVQQKLKTTAVVDQAKGTAQIPIERAMQLVALDLKNKPVGPSSVKVENPYPYGLAQAPVAAAVPAAAASPAAAQPAPQRTASPVPSASSQEVQPR